MTLSTALVNTGVAAFGMGLPVLAPHWTKHAATVTPEPLESRMALRLDDSLSIADNGWLCPIAGFVQAFDLSTDAHLPTTLIGADGAPLPTTGERGLLLTVFEQTYLRLRRLYRRVFEPTFAPPAGDDGTLTLRPVPRYFLYVGEPSGDEPPRAGNAAPGDELGWFGRMSVHDRLGHPIDPLAVAAAFQALMAAHNPLQHRPSDASFITDTQLGRILTAHGATPAVRIRVSDHAGRPYADGDRLTGLTPVDAGAGLFTLNAASGTGSDLTGQVGKAAATAAEGAFPPEEHRTLLLGPSTTGRLTGTFQPVTLPAGVTLMRDFFSLRAVQVAPYLLGAPPEAFLGARLEPRPPVRMFEPLQLLADGNDVLGAAAAALTSGAPAERLVVAQRIDAGFPVPAALGPEAHWPAFPPLTAGEVPAPAGPLPVALRDGLTLAANYVSEAGSSVDVHLTVGGLPVGAAVKVFPRRFIQDAREARGAGVGAVAGAAGSVRMLLRDPFSFRTAATLTTPVVGTPSALLRFDMIVVKRTGEARTYGNLSVDVGPPAPPPESTPVTNPFGAAPRRGICHAGILNTGLQPVEAPAVGAASGDELLRIVRLLAGEPEPGGAARDAPRLPTMARRDLLVAGLHATAWRAVLSGGRLAPESHSAQPRLGTPGGGGGRESQLAGVTTQGGRLAFDIARMAFRRTTNLVERMVALADEEWNEPPAATAPAASDSGPTAHTFCGAVLQTIAPSCETPELNLFKYFVEQNPDAVPRQFDELIEWLKRQVSEAEAAAEPVLGDILAALGLSRGRLGTELDRLRDEVLGAIDDLADDDTSESRNERLFNELRRELMAAIYGRRDAQWALERAIGDARRFIYIESPGFAPTRGQYAEGTELPPYARDLIGQLNSQLQAVPGLRVIVCTPRRPDYGIGYEGFAAREVQERYAAITALPGRRVVSFHPLGFPGLQSLIDSFVVIVDDVWALVGSSSFRRRGLTFDGGSDLVFTDADLVDGRSPAIARFRRELMASRLGILANEAGDFGLLRHPTFVRLNDGAEGMAVVREQHLAGGLGTIEKLWNGRLRGVAPPATPPAPADVVNPEGLEFDIIQLWAHAFIAGLGTPSVPFL